MQKEATQNRDLHSLRDLVEAQTASGTRIQSLHLIGKRVLVTGAGGSIGSALAESIWASGPESLSLLDSSENGLYTVDRLLRDVGSVDHTATLGSVCDRSVVLHAFETHRPQIIFHAAACKHVPLMEQNPFAAIANNAVGTLLLAETAAAFHAEQFVLVSTDKAVDPLSIMGASKRIAELAVLAIGRNVSTRMKAVRLGNVAGSQGSVIPLFLDQIARGMPLTVTHPEARRYFMTVGHAVDSLLAALDVPAASILVPDLGRPVRILDLARYLLELNASSVGIEFIGLRPGDKMTESLLAQGERRFTLTQSEKATLHEIEGSIPVSSELFRCVNELSEAVIARDLSGLLRGVMALVPGYQPSQTIQAGLKANILA